MPTHLNLGTAAAVVLTAGTPIQATIFIARTTESADRTRSDLAVLRCTDYGNLLLLAGPADASV